VIGDVVLQLAALCSAICIWAVGQTVAVITGKRDVWKVVEKEAVGTTANGTFDRA
jgi:hypothetical protein